jgi:cyclase
MKKKRIIPILILKDGFLVQSKLFNEYKKIGNPIAGVKRFSDWDADELIYLDIDQGKKFGPNREDTAGLKFESSIDALESISSVANMPITIGGGISSLPEIEERLKSGADKIALNTQALLNPKFINAAAREFGSQCIVISIDYVSNSGIATVHNRNIDSSILPKVAEWSKKVQDLGAGEVLLNSVERDGMKCGYDLEILGSISESLAIPVIGCGGAGSWQDMAILLSETSVDAVAAANIFHFQDQSIYLARSELFQMGLPVRPPSLSGIR